MKTMRLGKYFLSTAIMAFLLFSTGNAFGLNAHRNCDNGSGTTNASGCDNANNFMVVSPYWQVDSGSYTFIAVTHSSLSGMASQIGLKVNALTSSGAAYDTAESFTITAGNTERLFIVPESHATINSSDIPNAKFMTGTSDFTYGSVRVNPIMSHPNLKYAQKVTGTEPALAGDGFRDITMLSYWGSVIIEANTTGFAMEFIGDMNDSIATFNTDHNWSTGSCQAATHDVHGTGETMTAYRDCGNLTTNRSKYETMSTGPNLQ